MPSKNRFWPLSVLVIIVSFLSLAVIQRQVMAQWIPPGSNPVEVNNNNFVFTPMVRDLNLNGKKVSNGTNFVVDPAGAAYLQVTAVGTNNAADFTGPICLNGACIDTWASGGGGSGDSLWSINAAQNNAIYYTTSTPASGRVGIGTNNPAQLLHLYKISGDNAELDIQSINEANSHWGIYQDRSTYQLRFWQGDNRVYFGRYGDVSINTAIDPLVNSQLYVKATTAGKTGILGEGTIGVRGSGNIGVGATGVGSGVALNVIASDYTGALAASFSGDIYIPVGEFGIGTIADPNYKLYSVATSTTAIRGQTQTGYGVYGYASDLSSGTGVYGSGLTGVRGVALANGTGVRGDQGAGTYAAYFNGRTVLNGLTQVTNGNLLIPNGVGAPTAACGAMTGTTGAIYLDYTFSTPRLYICAGSNGWKSIAL